MVSSVSSSVSSSYPVLTLEHVQEAERMSADLACSEEQFRLRLAAFSQAGSSQECNDDNNNQDLDNTNQNIAIEEIVSCKQTKSPSDTEGCDNDPDKMSEEQMKAIEAVKSTFVTLLTSSTTDQQ